MTQIIQQKQLNTSGSGASFPPVQIATAGSYTVSSNTQVIAKKIHCAASGSGTSGGQLHLVGALHL
jgi:hypothetical protein